MRPQLVLDGILEGIELRPPLPRRSRVEVSIISIQYAIKAQLELVLKLEGLERWETEYSKPNPRRPAPSPSNDPIFHLGFLFPSFLFSFFSRPSPALT